MLGASAISYSEGVKRGLEFPENPSGMLALVFWGFIDAMALTALVFLHRRLGERFFTAVHYILGCFLLFGVAFSGTLGLGLSHAFQQQGAAQPSGGYAFASALYAFAFMAVGAMRLFGIFLRSRRDDWSVLSRSFGEPYLLKLGLNYWLTITVAEPVAILLLALVFHLLGGTASALYFVMIAFFAFVAGTHQYRLEREALLDANDARLLAQHRQALLKLIESGQKPTNDAGGVFRPSLLPRNREDSLSLLRGMVEAARRPEGFPAEEAPSGVSERAPKAS